MINGLYGFVFGGAGISGIRRAAIVIAGVIGETIAEFGLTKSDPKTTRRGKKKAGEERLASGTRLTRLSALTLIAGWAIELLALVQTNRLANERAQALNLEIASQREKAANAERELIVLQQRIQDRHLTMEQREAMSKVLSSGSKSPVEILCVGDNLEAYAFAKEIIEVLSRSGWSPTEVMIALYNPPPSGVLVREGSPRTPTALTLQTAFEVSGVTSRVELTAQIPQGAVQIVVGSKP